jgi:hypothetical protein
VLTRTQLVDICGAVHWSDPGFRQALIRAVSIGRVTRLAEDLYEIRRSTGPTTQPLPEHRSGDGGSVAPIELRSKPAPADRALRDRRRRSIDAVLQQLRRDKTEARAAH